MFEPDEVRSCARQAIKEQDNFLVLPPEFEESFLGISSSSKVSWMKTTSAAPEEFALDPLAHYSYHLKFLSYVLSWLPPDMFGFQPANSCTDTMIRVPLSGDPERQALDPGPLDDEDIEAGRVETFLDYAQRRRLCILYMVDGEGGEIELLPWGDSSNEPFRLPITKDRILVFRHDMFSYTYRPLSPDDLVLQAWVCEDPHQLWLDKFKGSQTAVEMLSVEPDAIPIVPPDKQAHVMNCLVKYPGRAYGYAKAWCTWAFQADCFLKVPSARYDMDIYYADPSEDNLNGKSASQHSGFIGDDELINFDNKLFGINDGMASMMPPVQRTLIETCYENFLMNGYTLSTIRHKRIMLVNAECQGALDWDHFQGHDDDCDNWLRTAVGFGITTGARLGHIFQTTGPMISTDTACSSSLVATNIAFAVLRKAQADNLDIREAQICSGKNDLMPFPYIGLSAAGMVGKGGRCFFADLCANGFTRGEGFAALYMKTSDDAQVTHERIGSMLNGFTNQDGRSASLTAPNGPSQQGCIRSCMRQGGIPPDDISMIECHGTGTALGDPIERARAAPSSSAARSASASPAPSPSTGTWKKVRGWCASSRR
jgi:polyketide synthase-associated protein